ncbi:hypothetical protein [Deinococcus sp.]|uniref:hypothetical protein n=1 Tax=Deinococcus sp. TaxID=47478 RepID=UPI0025BF1B53|nr:hypothetical protein [Deinococcus sp.]
MWLIAHNAWLHWLLETGVIGTAGLLAVMGCGLWRATRQGAPLTLAVLFDYTAMNVVRSGRSGSNRPARLFSD